MDKVNGEQIKVEIKMLKENQLLNEVNFSFRSVCVEIEN